MHVYHVPSGVMRLLYVRTRSLRMAGCAAQLPPSTRADCRCPTNDAACCFCSTAQCRPACRACSTACASLHPHYNQLLSSIRIVSCSHLQ